MQNLQYHPFHLKLIAWFEAVIWKLCFKLCIIEVIDVPGLSG